MDLQKEADSVVVSWFDGFEEFFERRKIYLQYPWKLKGVYRPGDLIRVRNDVVAEPYTCHPASRIASFGAFSYCRTPRIAPDFQLGRYCSVATGVQLSDLEHPLDRISTHPFTTHPHMSELAETEFGRSTRITPHRFNGPPPQIGNDVWIGQEAMLKRGIRIGDGAVVGARSLVTKDVPPYAVVGGSPARILKYRIEDPRLRERLLLLKWWNYNYAEFPEHDPRDVSGFVSRLEELVAVGHIKKFSPPKVHVADELEEWLENRQ